MKVAIIGSRGYPYVYSGYETFVRELSERMVKRGIAVRVYCHKGLFADRPREVNGIELVYLPSIEANPSYFAIKQKHNCSLMHCSENTSQRLGCLLRLQLI